MYRFYILLVRGSISMFIGMEKVICLKALSNQSIDSELPHRISWLASYFSHSQPEITPHTHHIANSIQHYIVDFYTASVKDVGMGTSINICTLNKSIGFFQKVSIFTVSLYCYFTTTFYLHNIFVIGLLSYHRFHFNLIHLNQFFLFVFFYDLNWVLHIHYTYIIYCSIICLLFYILSIEYSVFAIVFLVTVADAFCHQWISWMYFPFVYFMNWSIA